MYSSYILQSKSESALTAPNIDHESNRHRYLFSPQISGYIDPTDATLSLAMCCITYLSQEHHDREIDDEEMAYNLLSGLYRFHEFATTMWLELIERVTRFYSLGSMPKELIAILETFLAERKNRHYKGTTAKSVERRFSSFKKDWPELHDILCKAAGFRHVSSKAEYNKNKGTLSTRRFETESLHLTSYSNLMG